MFEEIVDALNGIVWGLGIPVGDQEIPFVVIALIGVGVFLTIRMGFVQIRHLAHGFGVTSGKYDDPNEPGDVPHFQALTTALSATVGIGNIAGVAIAIHWGGPGALFWMWITAFLGMATKFTEVTLAQRYREVESADAQKEHTWSGAVSGGPMYYIEKGLGEKWRPMAMVFAVLLGVTAFLTGNGIQANTVADTMNTEFGMSPWVTGIITSAVVGIVILGGIQRIGKVTAVLAPAMAGVYVLGALYIILSHMGEIIPTFGLIISEAFNPTAGVAGTGVGAVLVTMMWGVKRGLFSNEAGQGSAPIAHAAAKTDEPISEGVVALLEPFIDTLVICTMTALVIIMTGVWQERVPTEITLGEGDVSWVTVEADGKVTQGAEPPERVVYENGVATGDTSVRLAWHEVALEQVFTDAEMTVPFTGVIEGPKATPAEGGEMTSLWAGAVENAAPLTALGFQRGLPGNWGRFIVVMSVLLFAISTAISWSYYGDRCAYYIFGSKAVLPYKLVFVLMHFVGAVLPLTVIWDLGDLFLGIVIIPNLIALVMLSGNVREQLSSYFERKPYLHQPGAEKGE